MKVKVKLRDRNSIFSDTSQNATITGDNILEVKYTSRIASAINGGALIKVEDIKEKVDVKKPDTQKVEDKKVEDKKSK